jgi:hypothetical protein
VNLTVPGFFGLLLVLLSFSLIVVFAAAGRNRPGRHLRELPAFTRLRRAVGLAVEVGTRVHISLGRGDLLGTQNAAAFSGLVMADRIARAASISDRPPVATAGEGSLAILAQDTLRASFRTLGVESQFNPNSAQPTGLTPFSYAVGTIPVIHDGQISANLLSGHFSGEAALIADAAERSGSLVVGGSDNLSGQAVLFASAQEPLIGEEVFAGGAYLGAGTFHEASLRMQDVLRWVLVAVILIGVLFKITGLDLVISDIFEGFLP